MRRGPTFALVVVATTFLPQISEGRGPAFGLPIDVGAALRKQNTKLTLGVRPEMMWISEEMIGAGVYVEALSTRMEDVSVGGGATLLIGPIAFSTGPYMRRSHDKGTEGGLSVSLFLGLQGIWTDLRASPEFLWKTGIRMDGRFGLRENGDQAVLLVLEIDVLVLWFLAQYGAS
ncbi:MAG: hypothetical protein H6729_12680 [Deltaproteobacteria bacterium]|nr:hypothetical protein [Deltaproteobacteria bacterium]